MESDLWLVDLSRRSSCSSSLTLLSFGNLVNDLSKDFWWLSSRSSHLVIEHKEWNSIYLMLLAPFLFFLSRFVDQFVTLQEFESLSLVEACFCSHWRKPVYRSDIFTVFKITFENGFDDSILHDITSLLMSPLNKTVRSQSVSSNTIQGKLNSGPLTSTIQTLKNGIHFFLATTKLLQVHLALVESIYRSICPQEEGSPLNIEFEIGVLCADILDSLL